MNKIAAFVGHSFEESDEGLIRKFTDYFDSIAKTPMNFTWEHAKDAKPRGVSEKVLERMAGKGLFIGICTAKERVISLNQAPVSNDDVVKIPLKDTELKTSDWILQEIGFAFGKEMRIIILLEEGVRDVGNLLGDLEYIPFNRGDPEKSFRPLLDMITSMSQTIPRKYKSGY